MRKWMAAVLAVLIMAGIVPPVSAEQAATLIAVNENFGLENASGRVNMDADREHIAGKTLYFEIVGLGAGLRAPGTPLTRTSQLSNYKTSYVVDSGNQLVQKVSFVEKKNTSNAARAYLAVELRDTYTNEGENRLDLRITVEAKKPGAQIAVLNGGGYTQTDSCEIELSMDVLYGEEEGVGNGTFLMEDTPLLSFSEQADTVVLCFGENVEVSGDMRRDNNLFLRMRTRDDALEKRYPTAQLRLFDGPRKTFRRNVTVTIPADAVEGANGKPAAPFLYEQTDGKLYEVENAAYNVRDEMFTITTKTLGNYIIVEQQQGASAPKDKQNKAASSASPAQPGSSEEARPDSGGDPDEEGPAAEENPQTGS